MKSKIWFSGILAVAFALSLAGADVASAYCGGGACGQGGGRAVCRTDKGSCPNYKQGRGRKNGQGRQQCLRGSNCPVASPNATPATPPAPAPAN